MNTRAFERIISVVFFVCVVLFVSFLVGRRYVDSVSEAPEITVPDANVFSAAEGQSALLRDVSAYDREDGDLTDSVVVESVSAFDPDGRRTVVYAVCDSDRHVTKVRREITYNDYRSPEFSLKTQLCFTGNVTASAILGAVKANDVLDGDLSDHIKIDSYISGDAYDTVGLSVVNSAGDISKVSLNLSLVATMNGLPRVELSDYVVYLPKNGTFNPTSYLRRVMVSGEENPALMGRVHVTSSVDPGTAGSYTVAYEVTADTGITGISYMTVIVKE